MTRYLPAFRTATTGATPITVRQLLDQTSGLPGSATGLSTPVSTLAGQIASLATVEPASAPGTRYAYANANYVVLGGVIEAVSGQSYADAMQIARLRAARDDPHDGRSRRRRGARPG